MIDQRIQPVHRPRGPLCQGRRQHGRRRGADGARAHLRRQRAGHQRGGADPGARWPQGADDEGRADDGDHPGPAAARICRRAPDPAERRAADGRGLRQAPHDGGARRELAGALRLVRPESRGRRLARPGPQGDDHSTARPSPASCSTPTCSRRSKPTSISSTCCSGCTASSALESTRARWRKRSATGSARSSTMRMRRRHAALYADILADTPGRCASRGCIATCRRSAC